MYFPILLKKMIYFTNCVGTTGCSHKKNLKCCAAFGCSKSGTERSHVHVNGNKKEIFLVMLCKSHNNHTNKEPFRGKTTAAIIKMPDCKCCKCGCRWNKVKNVLIVILLIFLIYCLLKMWFSHRIKS